MRTTLALSLFLALTLAGARASAQDGEPAVNPATDGSAAAPDAPSDDATDPTPPPGERTRDTTPDDARADDDRAAPEPLAPDAVDPAASPSLPSGSESLPVPPTSADRVAVLLVPTGHVDPATTDALTELLISAVAARGVTQIVGKEELLALLHRDDAGILACVESGICLGQISVELGVHEVVAGTLGERDGRWVFALARIDARTGATSGRVFREVEGDISVLVGSLASSVPELYIEAVRPGRLVLDVRDAVTREHVVGAEVLLDDVSLGLTRDEPFRRELIAPGVHTLDVRSPNHRTLTREIDVEDGATMLLDASLVRVERNFELSALTWLPAALGVGLLGGAIGLGVVSQDSPNATATMRETFEFFDAREREAIAASVLYAAAGAALGLAVISLTLDLLSSSGTGDTVRAELGPTGITLRGPLP